MHTGDSRWSSGVTMIDILVKNSTLSQTRITSHVYLVQDFDTYEGTLCIEDSQMKLGNIWNSLIHTTHVLSPWRHKSPKRDVEWCNGRKYIKVIGSLFLKMSITFRKLWVQPWMETYKDQKDHSLGHRFLHSKMDIYFSFIYDEC